MKRLRPSATARVPGNGPPVTAESPPETGARDQVEGNRVPRWGSLASSGLPLAVSVPSTTQLLEPRPSERAPGRMSRTTGSPLDSEAKNARARLGAPGGARRGVPGASLDPSGPPPTEPCAES